LEQRLAQKLAREKELLAETLAREQAEREEARSQALEARSHEIAREVQQLLTTSADCYAHFQKTQTLPALFWAPNSPSSNP
jgi:heterodisulfide reductase subunit B